MDKKRDFGMANLAKKTFAVITASLSALIPAKSKALPIMNNIDGSGSNNNEHAKKRNPLPRLVLKLNMSNPDMSPVVMHTSHRSHSSHSSHYSSSSSGHSSHTSHSSHSSHYSSSPSYSPPVPSSSPVKVETKTPKVPWYKSPGTSNNTTTTPPSANNEALPFHKLGSRTLYKGCIGTDVKELQELLTGLSYSISADGSFGSGTYQAVIRFQKSNSLKADGVVGPQTLAVLKSK